MSEELTEADMLEIGKQAKRHFLILLNVMVQDDVCQAMAGMAWKQLQAYRAVGFTQEEAMQLVLASTQKTASK